MKRKFSLGMRVLFLFFSLIIISIVLSSGCTEQKPSPGTEIEHLNYMQATQMPFISPGHSKNYSFEDAVSVNNKIISKLNADQLLVDNLINDSAYQIAAGNLDPKDISSVLVSTQNNSSYIKTVNFLDPDLRLIAVSSDQYKNLIGSNLSNQEHLVKTVILKKPWMSPVIQTAEGFPACSLAYPVIYNNSFKGVVYCIIRPEEIISDAFRSGDPDNRFEDFVMQPNGLIIYDEDPLQTGRNALMDSLYSTESSLIDVVRKMESNPKGNGTYRFHDMPSPEIITKEATWDTIKIHGVEWRIVVSRVLNNTY